MKRELIKVLRVKLNNDKQLENKLIEEIKTNDYNSVWNKLNYIVGSLSTYVIAIDTNNFIEVDFSKRYKFLEGCLKLQRDFTFFSDSLSVKMTIVKTKLNELILLPENTEEYNNLKSIIDEDLKNLIDLLVNEFNKYMRNVLNNNNSDAAILNYYVNYYVNIE